MPRTAGTNEEPPVKKTRSTSLGLTPAIQTTRSTQRSIASTSSEIQLAVHPRGDRQNLIRGTNRRAVAQGRGYQVANNSCIERVSSNSDPFIRKQILRPPAALAN